FLLLPFLSSSPPPPDPHSFPTRRSSDLLQDFNLFWLTRYGFAPSKVLFLAWSAWGEKYDYATLKHWLGVFITRFFANQYKRSAVDRKSTRLNSSHVKISYAVFCLKKKKP